MSGTFRKDLNEELGPEKVKTLYFGEDHTHTTVAGAELNAASVIAGLKGIKDCRLCAYLLGTGPAKRAAGN